MSVAALNGLRTRSNGKINASSPPASGGESKATGSGDAASPPVAVGAMQDDMTADTSSVCHAAAPGCKTSVK
jgi:hypothetical protein